MSRTKAILLNISASGALLKMESHEDIGSTILLLMRFNIPGQGRIYVSISAQICRKSETNEGNDYGIQWVQATCDDKPEGLRHLVEKVLVGTTGRIQVDRNREHTERVAYTFDFANLEAITQHALDFFEKNPDAYTTASNPPIQSTPISETTDYKETLTGTISLTEASDDTSLPQSEEKDSRKTMRQAAESTDAPTVVREAEAEAEVRVEEEEKTVSSTNNVFAMGGSDLTITESDSSDSDTENTLSDTLESAPESSPSNVLTLKKNEEETKPLGDSVPVIVTSEESPKSDMLDRTESTTQQNVSFKIPSSDVQPVEDISQDRRTSKRHRQTHQLVTTMIIRGNETSVIIRNMSRGGALVQTRHQVPDMDSTLTLKIESPQIRRAVRINGSVIRIVDEGSQNSLFAVHFTKPMHRGHAIELKRFFESVLPEN